MSGSWAAPLGIYLSNTYKGIMRTVRTHFFPPHVRINPGLNTSTVSGQHTGRTNLTKTDLIAMTKSVLLFGRMWILKSGIDRTFFRQVALYFPVVKHGFEGWFILTTSISLSIRTG